MPSHRRRYESDEEDRRHRRREDSKRRRKRDSSDSDSDYRSKRRKKDHKERKHDRDDRRRKKKKKKRKSENDNKPDKSKLFFMGDPLGHPPETKIDAETDYFSYHNEFWIYLFREEGVFFNDLDTNEARSSFKRFAKDYNAGKLEEPYYTRKFPNEVLQESKTTKHSWAFKTTTAERKGLGDLQKGIRMQTEYNNKKNQNTDVRTMDSLQSHQVSCAPVESLQRKPLSIQEQRTQQKRETKQWRERVKLTHEELTGGPKDFRERQIEKKREQSARIHGAHRDKETAGVELSDAALYGDDLEAARARLKSKERRKERQASRIQELQQKEEDRKNKMLEMLGLENLKGQKLEIAPRK